MIVEAFAPPLAFLPVGRTDQVRKQKQKKSRQKGGIFNIQKSKTYLHSDSRAILILPIDPILLRWKSFVSWGLKPALTALIL